MNVVNQAKQEAILTLIKVIDGGHLFPRVLAELQRTNLALPGADGPTKKKRVIADFKIIFDDIILPIGESVINLLIELGVAYLSTINPVVGAVVGSIVPGTEQAIESQINDKIISSK